MEKSIELDALNIFRQMNQSLSREDVDMLSPLQLAYIGDAVYELFVRTVILNRDQNSKLLHRKATSYVSASAQAELVHALEERLEEKEREMVRKGRNAKTNTSPKNAELIDYKYATGFECLMGYLYLSGKDERLTEIFEEIKKIKG